MRKILISTNMYKGSEFGQVLPYLKRFPGQVGVEVFPMFHEECFEKLSLIHISEPTRPY